MMQHSDISKSELADKIKSGEIVYAGNSRLKIYGTLKCASGKRMLRGNRVFFANKLEALKLGYRPCGHCMLAEYKEWKSVKSLTAKTQRR
jgi:methylphosphotriester-DNA--protein-cysteine methyltransferase